VNLDGLDVSILGPACVAGLIVLSTHVPLGRQVLSRGIIFIDLAIAQVAALGVILAQYLGVDEHGYGVEIAAAVAALAGAGLLAGPTSAGRNCRSRLIGTLFVLAATGGCCCSRTIPRAANTSRTCSSGRFCGSAYDQLMARALLSAALLAFVWWRRNRLRGLAFYGAFALAITVSVQLVGVYLVFASLIVPRFATVGPDGPRPVGRAYRRSASRVTCSGSRCRRCSICPAAR
jgi:zinc/manganese transport system permease protein